MRTLDDQERKVFQLRDNDLKALKGRKRCQCCGCIKSSPMSITPVMDATHADINLSGTLFIKLYTRKIACIHVWEERKETLPLLKEATAHFNQLFLQRLGHRQS